jgi:hypothetical protein
MSRLLLCGLVTLATACLGDGEGPTTENTVRPTVPSYTVVGVLFDSLAALRSSGLVANAPLRINGRPAITDTVGGFTVADVDSGNAVVRVEHPSYEPLTLPFLIDGNLQIAVGLRRYSPLITSFAVYPDSAVTTVVDLQGRKSVDRWSGSNATLDGADGSVTLIGSEMRWIPVDAFTWIIVFDVRGIQNVDWDLHDVTGFRFSVKCQAPDMCDHLIQREPTGGTQG